MITTSFLQNIKWKAKFAITKISFCAFCNLATKSPRILSKQANLKRLLPKWEELYVEYQSRIWRDDSTCSSWSICELWGCSDLNPLSNRHLWNTFIPGFDDLPNSNFELKRSSTVPARIKFLSIGECTSVVYWYSLPSTWEVYTVAFLYCLNVHFIL